MNLSCKYDSAILQLKKHFYSSNPSLETVFSTKIIDIKPFEVKIKPHAINLINIILIKFCFLLYSFVQC